MSSSQNPNHSAPNHAFSVVVAKKAQDLEPVKNNPGMAFLIAGLARNLGYHEQMEIIESVVREMEGRLSAYVIAQELMDCFSRKYKIKGTPTFLLYVNGREQDRLLGRITREMLLDFINRNMVQEPEKDKGE